VFVLLCHRDSWHKLGTGRIRIKIDNKKQFLTRKHLKNVEFCMKKGHFFNSNKFAGAEGANFVNGW
jgi:hypothetical protein